MKPWATLLVVVLHAGLSAQQSTFKVSVDLVSVDVLATNRGEPITGLAAADFEVRDNGVLQKVDSISGEGTAGGVVMRHVPLDVILVFDTSGSMAGRKLEQVADAGKAVLEKLRPGDRAALVTFSQRPSVSHALSPDVPSVAGALTRLRAAGRTSLFDALYMGFTMRRTTDTRAMLLILSDGRDNTSWLNARQLRQVARESDVVVYAVGLDAGVKEDVTVIAEETGGAFIVAQSPKDLKTLFARMVREMQARYVLSYYPTGVERAGWHTIEVRIPRKNAQITARRGYYVPR